MPSASSATPAMLRALNERTVLDAIRAGAPISRAEISRRVGISKPTVSLALRSLLEARLVREVNGASSRGSYGATLFEAVPEAKLVLGLDMGARFLRAAICDLSGEIRSRHDLETAGAGVHSLMEAAAQLKDQLLASADLPEEALDGAVLGVPGAVDPVSGTVRLAGNIHGLEGLRVGEELGQRLGVSVSVHNDINLAAVGELWHGVGRGVQNFAFISVGTGLGAGLVLRGELLVGQHGFAGELDFALSDTGQDYLGARPLCEYAASLVSDSGRPSSLRAPYTVPAIFGAARAGDALAGEVVEEAARRIVQYVLPIAAVTDVELVVLGGGVGANGDLLLAPIRERLGRALPFPPRVEVSSLGDGAVLAGALATGLTSALENAFTDRG